MVQVRLYASCSARSKVNKSKRHQDITFFCLLHIPIVFQVFYLRYVSRLRGVKILAFDAYKDVVVVCMEAWSSLHGSLLTCLPPDGKDIGVVCMEAWRPAACFSSQPGCYIPQPAAWRAAEHAKNLRIAYFLQGCWIGQHGCL